jgi:two-component system, NarL family, response regulator LiaR
VKQPALPEGENPSGNAGMPEWNIKKIPRRKTVMECQSIRIMLVDDHTLVRKGLKIVLEEFNGIHIIGEASNGLQATELVEQLNPDVILMDLSMPVMDGIEAIRRIIAIRPSQKILVLSAYLEDNKFVKVIQAGALGCVSKNINPEELAQAIRCVSLGKPWLDSSLALMILQSAENEDLPGRLQVELSNREIEILRLLMQGKKDHEIARDPVLTDVTVRTHISRILLKLHLENRVQAALYGLRSGLVSLTEIHQLVDTRWNS